MFSEELNFFITNQERLVREYKGKVLVIKGQAIIGVFSDPLVAYLEVQKEHVPGSFMIQPCEPGPDAYTATIASTILNM
ncbi:MAG: hypothetical protein AB9866_05450 [Syntrophobacteraceae bacterium]